MLFRRKKPTPVEFDKTGMVPVIRCSICTGEQVAGFKDTATGKFHEILFLRTQQDYQAFLDEYQVAQEDIRREW